MLTEKFLLLIPGTEYEAIASSSIMSQTPHMHVYLTDLLLLLSFLTVLTLTVH
jgi:hypothetical protein